MSWEREYAPVIPAFRKLRLQDHKFKAGLGNTERACLKKKKITNTKITLMKYTLKTIKRNNKINRHPNTKKPCI